MSLRNLPAGAFLLFLAVPAWALPDGADWSHDGGPGRPDCSACHFDAAPLRQDARLTLDGLPERIEPGARYDLALTLSAETLKVAGFVLRAEMNGAEAGAFEPLGEGLEAKGGALRSNAKGARPDAPGRVVWRFRWTAPEELAGPVRFYVAANAGNDDLSPFGDQVFLSVFQSSGR
ncbi:choice-of-anchor V domain-containing protein [Amphiplicatus metriothermophilus]|uniref:Reelin domain-containing protein n=1 Tax=Amphiplicatus metriothermophilus TaxID=1519374 RepID=A0A239PPY0_9PROT|nr:choice-of-anchor V domain-containing protein [Amphiplicatus metriothermophilus]MBB5518871.1 hypothetical protein [Amphiplicatus metriothermophilus]SNT71976.1 hypothetical protein SAMN06297382_0998 [Amphiplicatus metriothermophilus]